MQGDQDQQQHNNQDRKVNQQQHHEPQKCPRCESLNTKFCYYNNYSLSQPRYFCKACRRYWTQGGTLRNVPVGGGCRKGKRAKTMSSSSSPTSSRSVLQLQQQPQDHQLHHKSLMMSTGPSALNTLVGSQFFPGGSGSGYLSSMPSTQNLNQLMISSSQLGSGDSVSNLGLLPGFNAISSYGQRQMQSQLFKNNMEPQSSYPYEDHRGMFLQPTRTSGSMTDWPESFINKSNASASTVAASAGQSTIWSTTMGNNTSTTSGAGPSPNLTQWPNDLGGSFAASTPPQ